MSRKARIAAYAIAIAVLAGVFALYAKPQLAVSIGDVIWACFH